LTIEIGVRQDGILGQLVPPQPGRVEIRTADGVFGTADVDELGCFSVLPAPQSPFRMHLETGNSRALTPWVHV
jgi:hypothetical protein